MLFTWGPGPYMIYMDHFKKHSGQFPGCCFRLSIQKKTPRTLPGPELLAERRRMPASKRTSLPKQTWSRFSFPRPYYGYYYCCCCRYCCSYYYRCNLLVLLLQLLLLLMSLLLLLLLLVLLLWHLSLLLQLLLLLLLPPLLLLSCIPIPCPYHCYCCYWYCCIAATGTAAVQLPVAQAPPSCGGNDYSKSNSNSSGSSNKN